ncbi:MAG: hypothetical protein R3A11_03280 [Bdellovibrionota bacterium]
MKRQKSSLKSQSHRRWIEENLKSILSSLGDADQVANRYLLERGISRTNTSVLPSLAKWAIAGVCGTICVLAICSVLLVWKFGLCQSG